jgi:hypothetical protein
MNISPLETKSAYGIESKTSGSRSEKGLDYSDFDGVIQEKFGIINDIGILFSDCSEEKSLEAGDLKPSPRAMFAQSVQDRLMLGRPKKKIQKQ